MTHSAARSGGSVSPVVQVQGLQHRYKGATTAALSDINLTINAGSCFGLLGPNGAGKTTLISLLTGLLTPQQGLIEVAGLRYPGQAKDIKRLSALVPQEYAFYPTLTGRENLRFFAGLYEIPKSKMTAKMEYCVEVCGLTQVLDQRSAHYSGGIKRRLNLALGLLRDPQILYLDEPTVGIDAQSRFFILQAIERLNNAGMTIIYTSHYMEEVEQICDAAAIIDDGRVLLHEPMSALLQGSGQLIVKPRNTVSPADLDALALLVSVEWDGSRLALAPTLQYSPSRLLQELEQRGIEFERLEMGGTRLEQVYLSATRSELRA